MSDKPDDEQPEFVRLDHFLKLAGMADTGGQAKMMIQCGDVSVNGEIETRRRKKLYVGDVVSVGNDEFVIESVDD